MEAIWLYQFRLIVIGDSTVGKSCLIRRFTEGRFAQVSDPTVGVDFFSRLVEIDLGNALNCRFGTLQARNASGIVNLYLGLCYVRPFSLFCIIVNSLNVQ